MSAVIHTHYRITFKNGEFLQHIDIFNMQFEEVIESLLLLNSKKKSEIKQITITYDGGLGMKVIKAIKKPVEIEAVQWTGINRSEIEQFCGYQNVEFKVDIIDSTIGLQLIVKTLEGDMVANRGDYIIKGIKGEFYPCKEDIFEATYDIVG